MGTVAFVYIGAVVGAGFATGQEVWLFFGRYGLWGIAGIILSGLLLGAFGSAILGWAIKERTTEHRSLFQKLLGRKIRTAAEILLFLFLFIIVAVMEAAWGEIGWEFFGVAPNFAILILLLLALFALGRKDGVGRASTLLVPLLLVLMLIICLGSFTLPDARGPLENTPFFPWWLAAFFYAANNLLLSFSALCALAPSLETIREGGAG